MALAIVAPRAVQSLPTLAPRKHWYPDAWKKPQVLVAAASVRPPLPTFPYLPKIDLQWEEIEMTRGSFPSTITGILVLILTILIIGCCGKCFIRCAPFFHRCYKRYQSRHLTLSHYSPYSLLLALGDEKQTYLFEILQLPFPVTDFEFTADVFVSRIQVVDRFFPKLIITWPELKIKHRHAPLNFTIPAHINLNWRQAALARNMLEQPSYYVLFYIQSPQHDLMLMPLQNSNWNQQSSLANAPPGQVQDRPPLYPLINTSTNVTRL